MLSNDYGAIFKYLGSTIIYSEDINRDEAEGKLVFKRTARNQDKQVIKGFVRRSCDPGFLATCSCFVLVTGFFLTGRAAANPNIIDKRLEAVEIVEKVEEEQDHGLRSGSFIVVPVPFSNPVIGSGLTLGAGYMFTTAPETDLSFVAIAGMASSNGSEAIGIATDVSFENGWSFDLALAEAQLNYDLYFGSDSLSINQDGTLLNGGVDYKLSKELSVGAGLRYLDSDVDLDDDDDSVPTNLKPDLSVEVVTLELRASWDERDNKIYPTNGMRVSVSANAGDTVGAGDRQYGYGTATFDIYRPVSETGVVAGRLAVCGASSDAPFFDKCSIGFSDNFRGFDPLRYLDTRLLSAQAEFRQRLGQRFGLVAFGGLGYTGSSFGDLWDDSARIAVGAGVRYRVSQKFPVDLSVDVSRNNDKEENLYIFVGQRF